MLCKSCARNRIRRDGGTFGLCWKHKRSKCRLCGKLSAGNIYCSKCEHDGDIERWRQESVNPLAFDEDYEYLQVALRKEKLLEAKYHFHRAVEVGFRAMVLLLESVWGGLRDPKEKPQPDEEVIIKEAA